LDFKLAAVAMSQRDGVRVKDVAESLCIHAFLLSKWRREVRQGLLSGDTPAVNEPVVAELKRLREVESKYQQLAKEHDLLKTAIRFVSARKATSSPSSKQTVKIKF
jgi:transposase